ncbi:MAG: hypothetical protein V1809_05435 [Planctomycetota bacterium]
MPQYAPWRISVHPDCSAHCLLLVERGRATAWTRDVDVNGLCKDLQRMKKSARGFSATMIFPIRRLFQRTRPGKRVEMLRRFRSFATGRGRHHLLAVAVGGYMTANTRDEERIVRCASCTATSSGLSGVCERSTTGDTRPEAGGDSP